MRGSCGEAKFHAVAFGGRDLILPDQGGMWVLATLHYNSCFWVAMSSATTKKQLISFASFLLFITAHNEVGARLYFHRRLWFCPQGGGVCVARGHAWGAGMAGRQACMAGGHAWHACPPGRHYGYGRWSMSGRYASYWNAFLLVKLNLLVTCFPCRFCRLSFNGNLINLQY